MNDLSFETVLSFLMGFIGGLFTISFKSYFDHRLKKDELAYAHKLAIVEKKKELLLQHKLEMARKANENSQIDNIIKRLEKLEKVIDND